MGTTYNFRRLLNRYKSKAKDRGIKWNLSIEEFSKLTKGNCYLCGIGPARTVQLRQNKNYLDHPPYLYNGVDRVDSKIGYQFKNCRTCCGECNRMKSDMTLKKFKRHVKNIVKELL